MPRPKHRRTPIQQERAGLYKRVSLDRAAHGMQDEILSPETQEDRARAYCAAQDWIVASVEEDIDQSGYRQHYSHRPGLMRLLAAVERGELTKIVVYKFSRLSRRLKEFIELCDRIEAVGAGIVSVTEQVDTSTPAGRLIRNILASFAQFQSEEISEHIFETWMTKAKRGERPGGLAPFGTRNARGILEPDPETHTHLLRIFQTFRQTESLKAVWDYLTSAGIPAPRAGSSKTKEWNLNTIRGILTNPVYVGRLLWAGEEFQGKWDPLIPQELWEDVQSILGARQTAPPPRRDSRLLTGFLLCAECGRAMWTRYAKRSSNGEAHLRRLYWCCSPTNYRRACTIPALDGEELEKTVWEAVLQVIHNVGVESLVASVAQERLAKVDGTPQRRRESLLAEKEQIGQKVAVLLDLLGEGSITKEQFREQNQRLVERLKAIAADLASKTTPEPKGPDRTTVRDAAQAATKAITDEERRQILTALGARIEAGANSVHLTLLGIRVNLRPRRIGETWHFGDAYHRLDFQGSMLTDKQVTFIRRCYGWADKKKLAARLGRQYGTLVFVAGKLRQKGLLPSVSNEASS